MLKKVFLALIISACAVALTPMSGQIYASDDVADVNVPITEEDADSTVAGQEYASGDEDGDSAPITEEDSDSTTEGQDQASGGEEDVSVQLQEEEIDSKAAVRFNESNDEDDASLQVKAKAVNPAKAYQPVLNEYASYLERLDAKETIDPFSLAKYGYKYIPEGVAACAQDENYTGSGKSRPKYAFIDIDGNGIVELVIGGPSSHGARGYELGCIYTLDSNMTPKQLIESVSYRYRSDLMIYEDGVIAMVGSGGAETVYYSFYTIGGNAKLTLKDELIEDWGTFTYNNRNITKNEFDTILKQLQNKRYASLSWFGFKQVAAYDKKLAKISISSVKPAKKKMTVKWKKLSKKKRKTCSKIEVQYSLKKTFPWKQTVTKTVKKSAKKVKIKKLSAKKTYYVKIRTIKMVNGVKHVSKWSKVKKVKIK